MTLDHFLMILSDLSAILIALTSLVGTVRTHKKVNRFVDSNGAEK